MKNGYIRPILWNPPICNGKARAPPNIPRFWAVLGGFYIYRAVFICMFGYGWVCLGMAIYGVTSRMRSIYRVVTMVTVARVIYIALNCCNTSCYCWPGFPYTEILLSRSIIYRALQLYMIGSVYGWALYLCFHSLYNVCPAFIWVGLSIDMHTRATHSASSASLWFQVSFAFLV